MKLFVVALAGALLATPTFAQTADQLSAMCDFLQTGMIHRDQNFSAMYSGAPDAKGTYTLTRPYTWPNTGCGVAKGNKKTVLICTWEIDGIKTAQAAQAALKAVGDQVPSCIGTAYTRGTNAQGYLVFSLKGDARVDIAIHDVKGTYGLTIGVFGAS